MNRPPRSTPDSPEPVPTGATPSEAPERTAAAGSHLYAEPVSFEGRSLKGAPRSGDPKELAQPLDDAEIPVEDLLRVEPGPSGPHGCEWRLQEAGFANRPHCEATEFAILSIPSAMSEVAITEYPSRM